MKAKHLILILISALLLYVSYYIYERLPVITGYAAKNMCSCVFVAERNPTHVQANELQFSLIKYAKNEINLEEKSVTSSILGIGKQTAYFHQDLGCALTKDKTSFLSIPKAKTLPNALSDSIYFPYGNKEVDTTPSNIDTLQIKKAIDFAFFDSDTSKPFGTRGVVILHRGQIIGERYAKGFNKNTKQLGWSMGKSLTSALIGVLVEQKIISDINNRVPIKAWMKDERKQITWNNLLQMSSGLKWKEDYGDISEATIMLYLRENMYEFATQQKLNSTPNTEWIYSSGSSNILSGLLKVVVGDDYLNFPYQNLFYKIGMNSMVLETDASGNFIGSSYPWATPRDWAKFGQLYLNNGNWNGEQIFPKWWAKYTSKPADSSNGMYGAQFWLHNDIEFPDVPSDMFFADGFQGQRIFIIPSKDLVIVRLGTSLFEHLNYNEFIKLILKGINEA